MAIYRNEARIIGRQAKDKAGKVIPGLYVSVVAKAAYRSGEKLRDERREKTFNYRARSQEVVHSEIMAPESAPDWLTSGEKHGAGDKQRETRERLWNTIERVEKRKDSQFAREFILALPIELTPDQHLELVRDWCQKVIVSKGYVVDFAIHKSWNGENPHAHILQVLRPTDANAPEGFGKKPDMSGKFNGRGSVGKGAKADLADWRKTWGDAENAALERAGRPERVDHRSLADQGIDRIPEPKIGVDATAMQRRGKVADPDRVRLTRWARMDNQIRHALSSIKQYGEVTQWGAGSAWWERAQIAIGRATSEARELLRDETSGGRSPSSWQSYVSNRNTIPERKQPEPEKGIG